jgi:hypothetical protein
MHRFKPNFLFKSLFFTATLSMFLMRTSSLADVEATQIVLPDSYVLKTENGKVGLEIEENLDHSHTVSLLLVPSYKAAKMHLIQETQGAFPLTEVLEIPYEPSKFRFFADFIENSKTVRVIERTYFGDQIRIVAKVSADLSSEQVRTLFTFSTVYGTVEGKVKCPTGFGHRICGRKIPPLPAFNQSRIFDPDSSKEIDALREHFFLLNQFKTDLFLGKFEHLPGENLDSMALRIWSEQRSCNSNDDKHLNRTCSVVKTYSSQMSLTEAIKFLANEAFPMPFSPQTFSNSLFPVDFAKAFMEDPSPPSNTPTPASPRPAVKAPTPKPCVKIPDPRFPPFGPKSRLICKVE